MGGVRRFADGGVVSGHAATHVLVPGHLQGNVTDQRMLVRHQRKTSMESVGVGNDMTGNNRRDRMGWPLTAKIDGATWTFLKFHIGLKGHTL